MTRRLHTLGPVLIKANKLPPRPKINELEITEVFLAGGSGPGGQKINKTCSKVQLKHLPSGLIVECQATRSREQNRKKAREILALKVQHFYDPDNSRTAVLGQRKIDQAKNKDKKTKKKHKSIEEERKLKKLEVEEEELAFLASMMNKG